jgi:hypothetical protein
MHGLEIVFWLPVRPLASFFLPGGVSCGGLLLFQWLRRWRPICDACGGRCLAGISETEARSLGAVAVAKPLDGCGWLGMVMMMVMLIWVMLFTGYMIVCGIGIWICDESCANYSTGNARTCLQCGLQDAGIKMLVCTHGHEHGAWTIQQPVQAKMMCLFDMDVSVRDTGEDRRLQL